MSTQDESLPSSAWWKQHADELTGTVTVEHLLTLFHPRGQALFSDIPKQPFFLADLAKFTVDAANSTIVKGAENGPTTLRVHAVPSQGGNLIVPNAFGLGERTLSFVLCTVSSDQNKLTIDVAVSANPQINASFVFTQTYPLEKYLSELGHAGPYDDFSVAGILASLVGEPRAIGFFADLPVAFCSVIDLASYVVDVPGTTMQFVASPFGLEIEKATLHLQVKTLPMPPSIGGLEFRLHNAKITLQRVATSGEPMFELALSLTLAVKANDTEVYLTGTLHRLSEGPFSLSFTASDSTRISLNQQGCSLSTLCAMLGIAGANNLALPFGESTLPLDDIYARVGCTYTQLAQGANSPFKRKRVFIGIDVTKVKTNEFLPNGLVPERITEATAFFEGPQMDLGLSLAYRLPVKQESADLVPERQKSADLIFSVTVLPIRYSSVALSYAVNVNISLASDPASKFGPPSLDALLNKLTLDSWSSITENIPVLHDISNNLSFVSAAMELSIEKSIPTVTAWAIGARVSRWDILSQPAITLENVDVRISRDVDWQCAVETTISFGDEGLQASAEFVLPTKNSQGYFRFKNTDDNFTLNAFAKEINKSSDPPIDLTKIPVVGDAVANTRLSFVSLHIVSQDGKLSIPGFEVELLWDSHNIGQLRMGPSKLLISWHREVLALEGGEGDAGHWMIEWAGGVEPDWNITARVQSLYQKESSKVTVSGELLVGTEKRQIGGVVDALTRPEEVLPPPPEPSPTTPLPAPSIWAESTPPSVTSKFHLERLYLSATLEDQTSTYAVAGAARWGATGSGSAVLVVERPADKKAPWDFTFAVGIKNLNLTDVFSEDLGQDISTQLIIKDAYLLVFRYGTPLALGQIQQKLQSYGAWEHISAAHNPHGTLIDSNGKTATGDKLLAGFAFAADLELTSSPEGSPLNNLLVLGNSSSLPSSIKVACCIQKQTQDQGWNDIAFAAQLQNVKLATEVSLEDLSLLYMRKPRPREHGTPDTAPLQYDRLVELRAQCVLHFPSNISWTLHGQLRIFNDYATSIFSLKTQDMAELGKIVLNNVQLVIGYKFAAASQPATSKEVIRGGRKATWDAALNAEVKISGVDVLLEAEIGDGMSPQVFVMKPKAAQSIAIGALIQDIIGMELPRDILNVTLENWEIYYAWEEVPRRSSQPEQPPQTYKQGLTASAMLKIYDMPFTITANINPAEGPEKGFSLDGSMSLPVDFAGISIHGGVGHELLGPGLTIFSKEKGTGCTLHGGVTLFNTTDGVVGGVNLSYTDGKFQGKLQVKADFIPLSNNTASVQFEVVEGPDGKKRFKLRGLPAIFDDLITPKDFIDAISELSSAETGTCGALKLLIKDGFKNKLDTNVSLSESQPTKEDGNPLTVALDLKGKFSVVIGGMVSAAEVDFGPIPLYVTIPSKLTMSEFAKSFAQSIVTSAPGIIKYMYKNQTEFGKIVAVIAMKNATEDALFAYFCRGYGRKQGDQPNPGEQTSESADSDGGGSDGSGGGSGGSGLWDFLELIGELIAGGIELGLDIALIAIALAGAIAGAKYVALKTIGKWLFGLMYDDDDWRSKPVPSKPDLEQLGVEDPFKDVISIDFDRWTRCTDFSTALTTAALCGQEYRDAIRHLRRILGGGSLVEMLGWQQYGVYKDMRKHLVAKFTRLRGEFSDKWLSCDAQAVEMEIIEDERGERKLYARWKKPWDDANLSVAVSVWAGNEGEEEKEIFGPTFYPNSKIEGLSWTGRPLDKVRLKVVAFVILKIEAGQDSGGKEYVFLSAGKATECDKYTFKTQGKPFDDLATVGGWKELDAARPIAAVDVFTNSIPGGSPCITGLRIIYNTQRETKTVLHGNDDSSGSGGNISRNQLKIEDHQKIVGVVWRTSLVTDAEYTRKVVTELSFHVLDRKTGNSTIAGPFGGANGEDVVSHHSGEVLAFTGREGQQGDRFALFELSVVDVIQTEQVFDDLVALGGIEKELDTARPITAIEVFTGSVNNGLSSFVSGLRITYNTRSGPKTFTHGNDNPYGAEGSTSRAEVKVEDNQRIAGVLWRMSNPLETKLGRKVVTEISFHILDQKTGQSKVIGPFGGVYKESFSSHYSGEVLAFTGTESGGGDRFALFGLNVAGKAPPAPAVVEYFQTATA
ncbi:hypothetical protein D9757_014314 [Collybiopsis confluens]|uniref:Uncharacterized protein n=1 Tax=Collybiopsis confluens TaxID=2823264 RepID=A0A8H5CTV5_9AGAR|nr:hypothetical protein D9757_014314 [Collybiopsis confluens]